MTGLAAWQNFYVIAGSSAGALIGLQFVVVTLVAGMPRTPGMAEAGEAYSTPTVVHFATVLFLAAGMCAPWRDLAPVGALVGLAGLGGLGYCGRVTLRMRRQTAYQAEAEDWLFHSILPFLAYGMLAGAPVAGAVWTTGAGLFGVAGATLLLLLIGIHNAWDNVSYHVFVRPREDGEG